MGLDGAEAVLKLRALRCNGDSFGVPIAVVEAKRAYAISGKGLAQATFVSMQMVWKLWKSGWQKTPRERPGRVLVASDPLERVVLLLSRTGIAAKHLTAMFWRSRRNDLLAALK